MAVDLQNLVTGAQSCLCPWAGRLQPADGGRIPDILFRLSNQPHHNRKRKGEQKTEQRPGERHDDLVQRRDRRQRLSGAFAFAFNRLHRRHLGQRDIAPRGNCPQRIFDPADLLFPNRFPKPNGEPVNFQPAPPRRQEMAQLMDKNQQVEEQQHFENDKNDFQYRHIVDRLPQHWDALNIAAAGPL